MHESQQLEPLEATAPLTPRDASQAEARAMLAELKLLDLLRQLGQPVVVGSVALGLMAWRDLDVTLLCPDLDAEAIHVAMRPLAADPHVPRYECRIEHACARIAG